jgi:hypothetical protein
LDLLQDLGWALEQRVIELVLVQMELEQPFQIFVHLGFVR